MNNLWQDLRYGARVLLKRPGFALAAVLTLAVGIGANTAIFSVVNGVLLRPLPYGDADRIVTLWESKGASRDVHVSYPNFADWRERQHSFDSFSAYTGRWGGPSTVTGGAEPLRANAAGVFRDFFKVMNVAPMVGRTFTPEDHRAGAPPAVVVSYGFWQKALGGARDLAGKKLSVEGHTFDVVGVMPPEFDFPADTQLWYAREAFGDDTSARSSHNYIAVARLKDGITVEQAQADTDQIARALADEYPESNRGAGVAVVSLKDQLVGKVRPALLVLLAAVGFVLLIACANVANLLLARALSRRREFAVRLALGASRARLVRQLLTESLLLSVTGGALGVLSAYWLVGALARLAPANLPRVADIGVDSRTLLFTVGLTLLTSVVFGLAPALRASRPDVQDALKSGGATTDGAGGGLRSALVVAEVALTLVLLTGAGLLVKSFWRLLQVSPGFRTDDVLTMRLSLPEDAYKDDAQTVNFYRALFERLQSVPGVERAAMVNNLPMAGVDINGSFEIEGRPGDHSHGAGFRIVSPGYFDALGIPVLHGRAFTEQDDERAAPVAVVSERVARATWPNEDAVGKRIRSGMDNRSDVWMTIVGVVGDVRHAGLDARPSADLYVPVAQRPHRARDATIVVRTSSDLSALAPVIREQVRSIDRNLPVSFESMGQVFSRTVADRRYSAWLLGAFACVALLLSLVGIYGVMAFAVAQHTRELGIRVALGAQRADIYRLVFGQGLTLAAAGVGLGLVAALALTRVLAGMLFGVGAHDPATFALVSLLLVCAALAACFFPARRATRVDPMIALRCE